MAESGANRKRVSISGIVNGSPPPASKKMRLDLSESPQANPDTIEAVRQRNRALELDMKEKNRRIAFLAQKCDALYRQRVLANASLHSVRRQWTHVLDEIRGSIDALEALSASPASVGTWKKALEALESLGSVNVDPASLKLHLPDWFIAISSDKDESVELPSADSGEDSDDRVATSAELTAIAREAEEFGERKRKEAVELLQKLVAAVAQHGSDAGASALQYAHIVQEKHDAQEMVMRLKHQLDEYRHRLTSMERDLEYKETERHRACRDYDRLQKHVEERGADGSAISSDTKAASSGESVNGADHKAASGVKEEKNVVAHQEQAAREKTLRDNVAILSTKLYHERTKLDGFRRDLERYKALEQAWTKEEAALKQEFGDKIQQLREESAHHAEEFAKIRYKAKDIENHVVDKWQKKIAKMQAEVVKFKAQMDEVSIKNMALREKLSNASSFRDQLSEMKTDFDAVKRENERLQALVKQTEEREERVQRAFENAKVRELTEKVSMLENAKAELQKTCSALKETMEKNNDGQVEIYAKRLSEIAAKYESEVARHEATRAELEAARTAMEEVKATADASRDENDALVTEIETLATEMDEMRHARKKLLQQIDEKRNSCKKLHSQVQREEQAKAQYFEEITAVRLQASSLSAVHKHQKSVIDATKEALAAKEKELEQLKEHVKNTEALREAADSEKRKILREAEVAKQIYTTEATQKQQLMLQEKRRPCDQCDALRKRLEDMEKQLKIAKLSSSSTSSNSSGSALSDVEHLELQDLQKVVRCSVCQDRKKSVIITKCFHMFCKECVDNNLKSRNRKCPTCKKMFGQDDVKAVWIT